jgi:hypothetical protein
MPKVSMGSRLIDPLRRPKAHYGDESGFYGSRGSRRMSVDRDGRVKSDVAGLVGFPSVLLLGPLRLSAQQKGLGQMHLSPVLRARCVLHCIRTHSHPTLPIHVHRYFLVPRRHFPFCRGLSLRIGPRRSRVPCVDQVETADCNASSWFSVKKTLAMPVPTRSSENFARFRTRPAHRDL